MSRPTPMAAGPRVTQVRALALIFVLALLAGTASPVRLAAQDSAEAERIVGRALARAAWAEEQGFPGRYRCRMIRRVRRFTRDGGIRREETREFDIEPVDGVSFARLVARDGHPLTDVEIDAEQERKRLFAEAVANGSQRADGADDEIVFDKELVGRYTFHDDGVEQLRGRLSYRLSFEPRTGKLPIRRNIDYALNNAKGVLWVDHATFEVARVEFLLIDRVRMWWGLLGSISYARGAFDRYPIEEEVWAPLQLETFVDSRVLFRSSRRGEVSQWRDFEMVVDPSTRPFE